MKTTTKQQPSSSSISSQPLLLVPALIIAMITRVSLSNQTNLSLQQIDAYKNDDSDTGYRLDEEEELLLLKFMDC